MRFWSYLRQRHPIRDEELNAYIDGELDAAARARVEAHIDSCSVCQDVVGELRAVSQALQALPHVQAPRSFALRQADVESTPGQPFPGRAQQAGWLAGATPLLGGVATVAVLVFFVLVGVDVSDRSAGSDANMSAALIEQDSALDAEIQDGFYGSGDSERDVAAPLPSAEDGAEPSKEAPLPATGGDVPTDDLSNNGDVVRDEDPSDGGTLASLNQDPGGDDSSRIRMAEAATAAVALAAGGSLALVWWRRRV